MVNQFNEYQMFSMGIQKEIQDLIETQKYLQINQSNNYLDTYKQYGINEEDQNNTISINLANNNDLIQNTGITENKLIMQNNFDDQNSVHESNLTFNSIINNSNDNNKSKKNPNQPFTETVSDPEEHIYNLFIQLGNSFSNEKVIC